MEDEKLICPSGNYSSIKYQPDFLYLTTDPRINFIKRILELTLPYFHLSINPSSFRLKNLRDWMVELTADDLIEQMSWACKADCVFCYQKGSLPFMREKIRMTEEEIKTRLKYFSGGQGIIWCTPYENDEVLNNPYIEKVLNKVRQKNKEMIRIITNGIPLTHKMIKILKDAVPLFLDISLNSTNPELRTRLMNDPSPEVAVRSLPLLKRYKIPFVVKIVAWPGVPFTDIEQTISYADQNHAYRVEIGSPGITRYFPKVPFDCKKYWKKVVNFVNSNKI